MTIQIRPLIESDYALVAGWLSDPAINQWLYSEWRDRQISDKLVKLAANGPKNEMRVILAGDVRYGLACIGSIEAKDHSGVLWYLRGSGVERRDGAMTQGVALACRDVFEKVGLRSISASFQATNVASQKLLETVGFKNVGTLRKAFTVADVQVDRIIYDLLPEESLV